MTVDRLAQALARAGLSPAEAENKIRLAECALGALGAAGSREGTNAWYVPGRLEVLGKHTDYAGGRSLVGAVERGFVLVAAPRDDDRVALTDARSGERGEVSLSGDDGAVAPAWVVYPRAVARRLGRNFATARRGADVAFASDLPPEAGLSSSSALVTGVFLALASINDLAATEPYRENIRRREDLADFLGAVENGAAFGTLPGDEGVGTLGGSEDHTAILASEAGTLRQYSFCPTRYERSVAVPRSHVFAIASSGVAAAKTGGARHAYNRASLAARRVLALYDEETGLTHRSLAEAAAASPEAIARMRRLLKRVTDDTFAAGELQDRFEQFVEESVGIVPTAGYALLRGDLAHFGRLVGRSQAAAEQRLRNQVPETSALARLARELGAAAASAFGAGFGGSVWALVAHDAAAGFLESWRSAYAREFPGAAARAEFFLTGAGPGAVATTAS